jgi:hypothetical protein
MRRHGGKILGCPDKKYDGAIRRLFCEDCPKLLKAGVSCYDDPF